jgi:hypothetical protein
MGHFGGDPPRVHVIATLQRRRRRNQGIPGNLRTYLGVAGGPSSKIDLALAGGLVALDLEPNKKEVLGGR